MPHFISTTNPPAHLTRAECQYLEHLTAQNADDSLRHYLIIECWDETASDWMPALFYEPTHDVVQAIASELAPLWTHTQQPVYCTCARHYLRLLSAYRDVEAANKTFFVPFNAVHAFLAEIKTDASQQKAKLAALEQEIAKRDLAPTTEPDTLTEQRALLQQVVKRLEKISLQARQLCASLPNQIFYSQQEVADRVSALLSEAMSHDEIRTYGVLLVEGILERGISPEHRANRLAELSMAIAPYKAINLYPTTPTLEECPLCHLPHGYNFVELLLGDPNLLNRIIARLVDGKVRPKHLPRIVQALELWLFANTDADMEYQKKMFPGESLTGMLTGSMLATIHEMIAEIKKAVVSQPSSDSASTSTTSTGADSPPPPLPADIPAAN